MTFLPFHGGQLRQIAEHFGIETAALLDFSANINPEGPPSAVLSTLQASLNDPAILLQYPDMEEVALREAISGYAGVPPEQIVVANGFVPILEATLRVLPIKRCLLPLPAFLEYRKVLDCANVAVLTEELSQDSGFRYDIGRMLKMDCDAILLANPQNPTGVLHGREPLSDFSSKAAERNLYLLLDEAFIDYQPEVSLVSEIERFQNLVIFRSVTKFFAVPGLRVAYAVANEKLAAALRENLPPWTITTLASRAVASMLGDEKYQIHSRALNEERRERLRLELEALSIPTEPSAANFLFFQLPSGIDPSSFWQRMIRDHQIVLRSCANYDALPPGCFRIAVRNDSENARLIAALRQTLAACRGV